MKKFEVLNRIYKSGIVAVLRSESEDEGVKTAHACIAGGIHAIEVTFTAGHAQALIKRLTEEVDKCEVVIGAGTVLDSETARVAILCGAQYIVSPGFNIETAKLCHLYQVPYLPGCMNITEMMVAMESGVDVIKLFPGSHFGSDFIRAVKGGPLPQVNLMPTGGVTLENIEEWIKAGSVAVGVGQDLTAHAKTESYDLMTELAQKYVEHVKQARATLNECESCD